MEKGSEKPDIDPGISAYDIHDATTHLARLVEKVALDGIPIVITKAGRGLAQIVPLEANNKGKRRGFLAGKGFSFDARGFKSRDAEIADQFLANR